MSEKPALLASALGWTIAVYLAIAGLAQRNDPSSPAELAVGNAFLVLAGALAIIAFVMMLVYVDAREEANRSPATGSPAGGRDIKDG